MDNDLANSDKNDSPFCHLAQKVDTDHLKYIDVLKYFNDYNFKLMVTHKRYADHVENML